MMTLAQLKAYILAQLVAPVNQVQKVINVFNAVVDYFTGNTVTDIIPDWTAGLNFKLDGTEAGKYCKHPDANGNKRIFETKTDNNQGNEPPTDPNINENTHWLEVSQAGSSAIVEWEPKVFGAGLVIVFHNHSVDEEGLYKLTVAERPFTSADIETEITEGKWKLISGKEYFKGYYTSLANLEAAVPTGVIGNYAIVDSGSGSDAELYIWDEDEGWVAGGAPGDGGTWGSITGTLSDQTDLQAELDGKRNIGVRAPVTIANGVTEINCTAGSIQVLTISEPKIIDSIINPIVDEVITLILDGTFSLEFSTIDAVVEGVYNAGEENRVYIHCLKVTGGAEYRITFDNSLGGSGDGVEAFAALTEASPTLWPVTKAVSNKTLTITANRTFSAPTGMSSGWSGNCLVTASGAQRTLSIPAGSSHKMKGVGDDTTKNIIIPSGETYLVSWLYDGTNFWWWYVD